MKNLKVECPTWLEQKFNETAKLLGITPDQLAAYFFTKEAVHA